MKHAWIPRLAFSSAVALISCSLCACSSTKPVRRAATVTAAGAAAGAVATNQARQRATDAITPNRSSRDLPASERPASRE